MSATNDRMISLVVNKPLISIALILALLCHLVGSDEIRTNPHFGFKLLRPSETMSLRCYLMSNWSAEVSWFKRDHINQDFYQLNADNRTSMAGDELLLANTTKADAGDYQCSIYSKESGNVESKIIRARLGLEIGELLAPDSRQSVISYWPDDGSGIERLTVEEGAKLELHCGPKNDLLPMNATWLASEPNSRTINKYVRYNPTVFFEKEEKWPSTYVVMGAPNKGMKLVLNPIGKEHRRHFTCLIFDEFALQHTRQIFVRVRWRYMFVWPLVGILVELVVFLLIVYCATTETRLNIKSEKDELSKSYKCIATFSLWPRARSQSGKRLTRNLMFALQHSRPDDQCRIIC